MTQPPDEQPTVAWTPPTEPPIEPEPSVAPSTPTDADTTGQTAPEASTPPDATPATPATPAAPAAATPAAATDPQSPLISWAPSGAGAAGVAGSSDPAAPDAVPAAGAVVGWAPPSEALPPSPVEGYQTAGVGSRIVAWILDGFIVALATIGLLLVVIVITGGAIGQDPATATALTAVITLGMSFLYFVGFWTSASGATPGMRSLGLRLVAAPGGRPLAIGSGVMRWAAFGYPVLVLSFVPALSSIASYALTGWTIFLLITTAVSDTNQGIHDRWAGSAVLRRLGAGNGCAVVGCVLIAVAMVLLLFVLPFIAIASLGPEFWDEFRRQLEQAS